jgi:hypothetical protein
LLQQAKLNQTQAQGGSVTLIQRFGSAANLNIHLLCLVLDGVYQIKPNGQLAFIQTPAPTSKALAYTHPVARCHHASRDVAACVYATPSGIGSKATPSLNPISRSAGTERNVALKGHSASAG